MQAYLIMAHDNFNILEKLIKMLDNICHDIYIHIDKKVKNINFRYYETLARYSRVFFTERVSISWGDYTMVEAEYILLKAAMEYYAKYDYFHLISGVDLPLTSADSLNRFFDKAYSKNFIHFGYPVNKIESSRICHYHFFTGRRNIFNRVMTKLEQKIQEFLGINRMKGKEVYRGSQWFSIARPFAQYLIKNEETIKKQMKHVLIPDEFFVQTAIMNSPYRNTLSCNKFDDSCEQNLRYIDWTRGHPYTFCEGDFEEIMNSGCLFVRKLTEENGLWDMIYNRVAEKE